MDCKTKRETDILAIIPARKGSTRLPGKNIRDLNSKNLIVRTIEETLKSQLIRETILINDIDETEDIAHKYRIQRIEEPEELAQTNVPGIKIIRFAIDYLREQGRNEPEIIIYLQPTSPFRTSTHIDEALSLFLESNADSLASMCEAKERPEWMFYSGKGSRLVKYNKEWASGHYEAQKLFHLNGAIFVMRTSQFKKFQKVYYEGDAIGYEMSGEDSLDIDTELDFKIAELILKEREK